MLRNDKKNRRLFSTGFSPIQTTLRRILRFIQRIWLLMVFSLNFDTHTFQNINKNGLKAKLWQLFAPKNLPSNLFVEFIFAHLEYIRLLYLKSIKQLKWIGRQFSSFEANNQKARELVHISNSNCPEHILRIN